MQPGGRAHASARARSRDRNEIYNRARERERESESRRGESLCNAYIGRPTSSCHDDSHYAALYACYDNNNDNDDGDDDDDGNDDDDDHYSNGFHYRLLSRSLAPSRTVFCLLHLFPVPLVLHLPSYSPPPTPLSIHPSESSCSIQ